MIPQISEQFFFNDISNDLHKNKRVVGFEKGFLLPKLALEVIKKPSLSLISLNFNKVSTQNEDSLIYNRQQLSNFNNNILAINKKIENYNNKINKSLLVKIIHIFLSVVTLGYYNYKHSLRVEPIALMSLNEKTENDPLPQDNLLEIDSPLPLEAKKGELELIRDSIANKYTQQAEVTIEEDNLLELGDPSEIFLEIEQAPEIKNREQPAIRHACKLALQLRSAGRLGKHSQYWPEELWDWTLEDGSPLPLDPEDLIHTFMIYDLSGELKNKLQGDFSFQLPSALFDNKQEGDKLILRYKNELIELEIKQRGIISKTDNFQDCLECSKKESLREIEAGKYGFEECLFGPRLSPYLGYQITQQGKIFIVNFSDLNQCREGTINDFRKLKREKPKVLNEIVIAQKDSEMTLKIPLVGIKNRVDIVINEKFLCFYAIEFINMDGWVAANQRKINKFHELKQEYLYIFPWKELFPNNTLEQLQTFISQGVFDLKDGMFYLKSDVEHLSVNP